MRKKKREVPSDTFLLSTFDFEPTALWLARFKQNLIESSQWKRANEEKSWFLG
jgi:hypothetical protein